MPQQDTIHLSSITISAKHGCYEDEKQTPQTFLVDITCPLLYRFDKSDDLEKTLNYEQLRDIVREVFALPPRNLIETLAVEIAERVLGETIAERVTIKIKKPGVWQDCLPSVEITRQKE